MTCPKMNNNQGEKQKERMVDQHNIGISGDKNVISVIKGNDRGYEATKINSHSTKNRRKCEIRMR